MAFVGWLIALITDWSQSRSNLPPSAGKLHLRRLPINGLVGQLASRQSQVALWHLPMNGFVGQLAARRPQVALPRRLPMD